jgi:hypothetical protein
MDSKGTQDNSTPKKSTKTTGNKPARSKISRTHKPEDFELEEWQRQLRQ